eukprot:4079935-Amphidinium_carterae.1
MPPKRRSGITPALHDRGPKGKVVSHSLRMRGPQRYSDLTPAQHARGQENKNVLVHDHGPRGPDKVHDTHGPGRPGPKRKEKTNSNTQ